MQKEWPAEYLGKGVCGGGLGHDFVPPATWSFVDEEIQRFHINRDARPAEAPLRIAIQHDFVVQPNGEKQSFSDRWIELARDSDISVQLVDVFKEDALESIATCDGFMWRFGFDAFDLAAAKRILPAVEHGLQIPVFPSWKTAWHFEDKLSQYYLMTAASIPSPVTRVFWKEADALAFCQSADYPFVVKLSTGIRSNNVVLVRDLPQARALVRRLFGRGLKTFHPDKLSVRGMLGKSRLVRRWRGRPFASEPRHSGYFYAQEFLPGNDFDTRVTVIGERAFAFRRFNREGDFRASGSGKISWDPAFIDHDTLHLAFEVARKLGTQSVAIDGLRRGDTRLIGEISYAYGAWAIARCPGHWVRDPATLDLRWVEGSMRAEDAIFQDFVAEIDRKRSSLPSVAKAAE